MIQTQRAHHPRPSGASHTSNPSASASSTSLHRSESAASSSSSSRRIPLPPTPISPTNPSIHVQAIHDFDPNLIASTSAGNANTYLPFKTGEVIRVHVQDASGWWDGEITGETMGLRRGWFPSNYVKEMALRSAAPVESSTLSSTTTTTPTRAAAMERPSNASHTSQPSRSSQLSYSSQPSSQSTSVQTPQWTHHTQRSHSSQRSHPHLELQRQSSSQSSKSPQWTHQSQPSQSSQRSQRLHLDIDPREFDLRDAPHSRSASASTHASTSSRPLYLSKGLQDLYQPCVESLSLLEESLEKGNIRHLQPATAQVISAVRGVLARTDCLSKESVIVGRSPAMAQYRKTVLVALSRLVTVAKESTDPDKIELQEANLEYLAKAARMVFNVIRKFLHTANELGVEPISPKSAPMEQSKSAPGDSKVARGAVKALSLGDLRAAKRQQQQESGSESPPPPPMPVSARAASVAGRARSPSVASTPLSATFTSSSGRSSPMSYRSTHDRRGFGSIDSSSTSHSSPSLDSTPMPPSLPTSDEPADLLESIGLAEEALISMIAAFIGHIHSHNQGSHASSHAILIDMTKRTIDSVRRMLEIVEYIGKHPVSRQTRAREIAQLSLAKVKLYEAASDLCEKAEDATNKIYGNGTEDDYEKAKTKLLQTATGTLRGASESARLARLCVPDDDSISANVTPRPPSGFSGSTRTTPDSSLVLRDKVVGDRGPHTLSALHRKANSLSQLQKRYEQGALEEGDDDEEYVADTSRDDDLTMRPRPGLTRLDSDPAQRSRSTSLSSPAPPRIQHRSPSRSADLDKFTSDFTLPVRPGYGRANTYTPHSTSNDVSLRRLSVESERPAPITPSTAATSVDSPVLGYLKNDSGIIEPLDTDATPGKLRPAMPTRSVTAPIPSANTDVRFWVVAHDYDPREISFNSDGAMVGASLAVLVEKMTPHDVPPEHTLWQTFFYTFRLFTTPTELLTCLMARYDLLPPPQMAFGERERAIWIERKVVPVRLRIYNLLKAWLETYWRSDTDDVILFMLQQFVTDVIAQTLPAMAPRLQAIIRRRSSGPPTSRSVTSPVSATTPSGLPPTPVISKSLNTMLLKNPASSAIPITEFDTLELARQLTLLESRLFCRVAPEDLLQTGKKTIPELRALSTISNQITGWVADNVLNEQDAKRRAGLLKFYIKLADKCLSLNNFSTLFALLAGLNSSIVTRLKRTWDALPAKYRVIIDRLQTVIEHTKNHATYRARLREVEGPCLPFLGLILTDITFTAEGNPDTRPSVLDPEIKLVNQDKYAKLGRIAIDFVKYQQPFNFHELEPVQTFLRRVLAERGSHSLDALYRKSLMLEPRKGAEKINSAVEKPGWLGGKL